MKIDNLAPGNYYHIYNRGNNGSTIFFEKENYSYFLRLYDKYIQPVSHTYAWCLLKNHFHFLLYLKEKEEINLSDLSYSTKKQVTKADPSRQFSHFFNAYTQAINKKYGRTGSLLEKPFERKRIDSEDYLRKLIFYIHNNPVHHGLTTNMESYPWSSYTSLLSSQPTTLKRDEVISWFDSAENFRAFHKKEYFKNEEPFQGLEP
ncbi:hypothetical protein SAMN04488034_10449 [Salinimicrobium catena]|uniref:Transposase IS200-like domain-containing protein n=1 Tax=Salinimicrobium catena TaxID=390640 RepID=A0A1H5NDT8_9FLAO|nr:hypothetical protein [Salinimicrobium catena]SDL42227.1 hypothetical protein SAMN04488140_10449 [Salinimicrobium catena]SEE99017.1 hypothetical protein SAMN04488034_10449 [Salinimicrobium catena]